MVMFNNVIFTAHCYVFYLGVHCNHLAIVEIKHHCFKSNTLVTFVRIFFFLFFGYGEKCQLLTSLCFCLRAIKSPLNRNTSISKGCWIQPLRGGLVKDSRSQMQSLPTWPIWCTEALELLRTQFLSYSPIIVAVNALLALGPRRLPASSRAVEVLGQQMKHWAFLQRDGKAPNPGLLSSFAIRREINSEDS